MNTCCFSLSLSLSLSHTHTYTHVYSRDLALFLVGEDVTVRRYHLVYAHTHAQSICNSSTFTIWFILILMHRVLDKSFVFFSSHFIIVTNHCYYISIRLRIVIFVSFLIHGHCDRHRRTLFTFQSDISHLTSHHLRCIVVASSYSSHRNVRTQTCLLHSRRH